MRFFERLYDWLFCWTPGLQSILLLAIRLIWGIQFIFAGWPKLNDLSGTATSFASIGIPEPTAAALAVALIETIGGAFLVLGLLSRLSALLTTCVMLGAYFFAYPDSLKSWSLFITQSPFLFLYGSLIILAFGAGVFSLDYLIRPNTQKNKGFCS